MARITRYCSSVMPCSFSTGRKRASNRDAGDQDNYVQINSTVIAQPTPTQKVRRRLGCAEGIGIIPCDVPSALRLVGINQV
jgi:hypothetical protein